ncbi:MAG: biopolymer transporter ExbD [Cyanobacteria bacterium J06648_16]
MRLPPDEDSRAQINIVPMIDVVFAVLTFFILASLTLTPNQGLPVTLPEAATAKAQSEATLTLTITADNELFLDRDPVEVSTLAADVKARLAPGQTALVTINADAAAEHGWVVTAMDELRLIEGLRLGIATQAP